MDLNQVFKKYRDALEKLYRRRAEWNNEKKQIVKSTLEDIAKQYYQESLPFGIYVDEYKIFENMSAIQFYLGQIPSGIVKKSEKQTTDGILYGPSVVFGQGNDGRIYISIYHFIDVLPSEGYQQPKSELLDIIEPEHITKECVTATVEKFLNSVLEQSHLENALSPKDIKQLQKKTIQGKDAGLAKILSFLNYIEEIREYGPFSLGNQFYVTGLHIYLLSKEEPILINKFQIGQYGFILEGKEIIFYDQIQRISYVGYSTGKSQEESL
jgi:hypothetical protein